LPNLDIGCDIDNLVLFFFRSIQALLYCFSIIKEIISEKKFTKSEQIILIHSLLIEDFKEIVKDYFHSDLEELVESNINIPTNKIVPISSSDGYNLVELVNKVVEVLPNEKKYAFTREAKDENVSEEAAKNAEKGIFDHIKEKVGDAWDFIKDDVIDAAVDVVKEFVVDKLPEAASKPVLQALDGVEVDDAVDMAKNVLGKFL
jgi:hypothetical protein